MSAALEIKLNRRSSVDLSEQLYEHLKRQILEGKLAAGERMPSSRDLSSRLRISRPTIAVCFEQLEKEGFIELKHGSGTFVSVQMKPALAPNARKQASIEKQPSISSYAKQLQKQAELQSKNFASAACSDEHPEIAFYSWRPALDQFPHTDWARILGRHARISADEDVDPFLDPQGEKSLRESISELVFRFRGVKCGADQVFISHGLNQSIDLVARLHADPKSAILVENPGYHLARSAFSSLGARVVSAPVDEEGMNIDHLLKSKGAPQLVYITPSHQFPTGQTMSLSRRLQLLAWASKTNTIILEDDYDSEFQKTGKPIPALMSLDKSNSVIYAGTLNQIMLPSLGLAYLIVPPPLVPLYQEAFKLLSAPMPQHVQTAIAQFIEEGHLDRHIKKLRLLYDERRETLLDELQAKLPDQVSITGSKSGVFIVVQIRTKLSPAQLLEKAYKAGIGLTSTEPFYLEKMEAHKNEYILGFGSLSTRLIKEGVKRLAALLKSK